jgi:hypothetical protein
MARAMDNRFVKGSPLPAALGRCGDLYREVRELRLAMDKEVAAVKEREQEIKDHIIANLSKSDDKGAVGLKFVTKVVSKAIVQVKDWAAFHAWIKKNDRFDLLEKRIAQTAATDFIEETGKIIPGTEIAHVLDLSVTKI